MRFFHVEVDTAALVSFCGENFLKFAHFENHRRNLRIFFEILFFAVDYSLHFRISHSLCGFYHRRLDFFIHDVAVRVDFHNAGNSQPFHTLVERTYAV